MAQSGSTLQNTIFRNVYDIAFQVSPIIFHNGLASAVPGGYLPIVALLGSLGLVQGAIAGNVSLSDFSYRFRPMPGSTMVNQSVGMYPFANQRVAANATIQEPLTVSLHMIAPVFVPGGYATKLALMEILTTLFEKQNNAGGDYLILTPAKIYQDCLMLTMTDITSGETKQDQAEFQIDFIKPLITQSEATVAMNSLMSKASGGQVVTSSSWSGAVTGSGTSMPGGFNPTAGSFGSGASFQNFIPGL